MTSLAAVLEGVSVGLTVGGIALKTIRTLRVYLTANMVVLDKEWDKKLGHISESGRRESREVTHSGWVNDEYIREESPSVRAAYECFDGIYNFLRAGKEEVAHFSGRLVVLDSDGHQLTTEGGHSVALRGSDNDKTAFNKVSDFVYGIKSTYLVKERFYSTSRTVLVLNANVMDDPRHIRCDEDSSEIISMAAVLLEVLKEVGNVVSDGHFIKVIPGSHLNPTYDWPSLAFITARWPGTDSKAVSAIKGMRAALDDAKADFEKLSADVDKWCLDDGVRNVILLGRTGAGKSHTGNWLLSRACADCVDRFAESNAGSLTDYVDYLPRGNAMVRFWDTPGLDDAYFRDSQFLDDIERATLEMGTISAAVLCFASIERIDGPVRSLVRKYSRIIGSALAKRLIVIINRQPTTVTERQKKGLQVAFFQDGGIEIEMQQIHDLGQNTDNQALKQLVAYKDLMGMCAKRAVKVGYLERLSTGLLELETITDAEEKEEAKAKLLRLSARALKRRLGEASGEVPLREKLNDGTKFILSNNLIFQDPDGTRFVEEHILRIPTVQHKRFRNKVAIFWKGVQLQYGGVQAICSRVREMRLVFAGDPAAVTVRERQGVVMTVRQLHYTLVSVDDALTQDVRDLLTHSLGDNDVNKVVSAFSIIRVKPGPKRR